jgi:hypothetical protein
VYYIHQIIKYAPSIYVCALFKFYYTFMYATLDVIENYINVL